MKSGYTRLPTSESEEYLSIEQPEISALPESDSDSIIDIPGNDKPAMPDFNDPIFDNIQTAKVYAPLWVGPLIVNAAYDATSIGTSLDQLKYPVAFIVPTAVSTAISSAGISDEFAHENFNEIGFILRNKRLPNYWVPLSKGREIPALAGAIIVTGYSAFAISVQAYAFVDYLVQTYAFEEAVAPYLLAFNIARGTFAGLVVVNMAFGKGFETYKSLRRLLAHEKITYANNFSYYFSPIVGGSLGIAYALQNAFSNLLDVTQALAIPPRNISKMSALGALSSLDATGDYWQNGAFGVASLDNLIGYLAKNSPTPKQVIAFILANGAAGLIAYGQYMIVQSTLETTATTTYEINDNPYTEPVIQGICGTVATAEYLIDASSIYPTAYWLINKIYNYFYPPVDPVVDDVDIEANQPLLDDEPENNSEPESTEVKVPTSAPQPIPARMNDRNLLFSKSNPERPSAPLSANQPLTRSL